jgi:glycosyltransferase involved in cell wall biosynthesis
LLRELSQDWRATCQKYNIYEDVFFTVVAPLCANCIAIPPSRTAVKFACEVNYSLLQKELLRLAPPTGIHGYDKYVDTDYLNYARGFFARKSVTYDGEVLPTSPLISVVMIVKNLISSGRAESFDQAITSVLNQTYERVEVVLLDGASIDGTFSMLQECYGHLGRVALHCKADSSVWEGMSNGVELATGDLIAVMNSDDYFSSPEALKLMVRRMLETNADMAYGRTLLLAEEGPRLFPTHFHSVLYCFGVVHQATLIKKSVIQTIAPFASGHITAENYLFVAILAAGFKAVLVPETLVHYRVGGLSTALYGGSNSDRTVNDYVLYMKKLTTIGNYLGDAEIRQLYGFSGMSKLGVVQFTRMVWRVGDRRLRYQLLSGILNILCWYGIRRLKLMN